MVEKAGDDAGLVERNQGTPRELGGRPAPKEREEAHSAGGYPPWKCPRGRGASTEDLPQVTNVCGHSMGLRGRG